MELFNEHKESKAFSSLADFNRDVRVYFSLNQHSFLFLGRQADHSIPKMASLKSMTLFLCARSDHFHRPFLHPLSTFEVLGSISGENWSVCIGNLNFVKLTPQT